MDSNIFQSTTKTKRRIKKLKLEIPWKTAVPDFTGRCRTNRKYFRGQSDMFFLRIYRYFPIWWSQTPQCMSENIPVRCSIIQCYYNLLNYSRKTHFFRISFPDSRFKTNRQVDRDGIGRAPRWQSGFTGWTDRYCDLRQPVNSSHGKIADKTLEHAIIDH